MHRTTRQTRSRPKVRTLAEAIARVTKGTDQPQRFRSSVIAASGAAIIGTALASFPATPVYAQEGAIDEITVTGSRIRRQDFTANSPILTVTDELFAETSAIGVETVLNRLPQFVPAVTQFTTGDVQQTATNTVGASTVSLRGLGANRNLVLINGRRAMPVGPTMEVDTNSIPAGAIQRVEVISGGASAVYGADAVGGVVNFILRDDFEGATVNVRFGDTQHGGDQTTTISGLIGANSADGRGNVMLGVERDTRSKQWVWERDWRVAELANPNTAGGFFTFGSTTWFHNEPNTPANNPSQAAVDAIFDEIAPGTISPSVAGFGSTQFRMNDDGTVFTGLQAQPTSSSVAGAYRFNGPVWNDGQSGDLDGDFQGLPVFVRQPNGNIKENQLYSWASIPLERLSGFASGRFDVADNIRVTGMATITRTKTETQLGLTAANINQWGAGIPFGDELYRGNADPVFNIPDSLCEFDANGNLPTGCTQEGVTNPLYTIDGRFGVECDAAPTPDRPWLDGQPGCTKSEAFPTSADMYNLMMSRPDPEAIIWASRPPDYLRHVLGGGRSTTNVTTTMSFSLGVEGELPSGNHFWDVSLYTGRSDNYVNQLGSMALGAYRGVLQFPNFGRGANMDPNPFEAGTFAKGNPTCETGLPIVERFVPSEDCIQMISPALKNERETTQTVFEANLTGTLAEMGAGPLQYALGTTYRENSFSFTPDNLSDNQNFTNAVAGLFPNEHSSGEFDVKELYGELLIPIVSNGPTGVQHFNVELGARVSDWSMPNMPNLYTYKALIDWAVTPRYRIRGGFNRAFRAPNLGELFIRRTQVFAGGGTRDWCSQNLNAAGDFSASVADPAQAAQTEAMCRDLMGPVGASEYYDGRPVADQPTGGGVGVPNSFGNPNLREEQADTYTLGVVMNFLENWTVTADYYSIEIEDMIALESGDSTYQKCMDIAFNPTGDLNNPACQRIIRNTTTGASAAVDRTFNNEGRAKMSGVDLSLNWSRPLGRGQFSMNTVANYNLESLTQDRDDLPEIDWAGFNGCALQLQCQRYEYRLFNTFSYFHGPWNLTLRHQYWPELDHNDCREMPQSNNCLRSSLPDYHLFALSGNYRFADRYMVSLGIENLADKAPPCVGGDANAAGFPTDCTRTGGFGPTGGATYDPLGRRFFVSMTMDF